MKTLIWKRGFLLAALAALTALAGCVPSQDEYNVLRSQVTKHEQALQQMNSQLSGVQPAQADTWSQVQSMRQELASLRGDMDNMNHAFTQAGGAQAMSDMLARHDRALRLIETQLAMDLQLSSPAGGGSATPGVGMPAPTAPAVPTAPQTGGAPQTPVRPATTDTAQALYDAGMTAFNARNYQQASKAFTDFTTTYPQHALAANSWFWQGESFFQMKNYRDAAVSYQKVIVSYPNSPKAPSAYLKQGLSFLQQGQKDAARERLKGLVQKYPNSPEATRAKQEIQNNKL